VAPVAVPRTQLRGQTWTKRSPHVSARVLLTQSAGAERAAGGRMCPPMEKGTPSGYRKGNALRDVEPAVTSAVGMAG
jgi:hypothetical protein